MNRLYKDINLNFNIDPVTGDIETHSDIESIKSSVKQLVLVNLYERVMHPEIGSQVNGLLFENDSMHLKLAVKSTIRSVLEQYEPRIDILDITVNSVQSSYSVNIYYSIIDLQLDSNVELLLSRVR